MEDFVTYELAVKLKGKGFDWETQYKYERNIFARRYEDIPMPSISQVLKWLREEKKLHIEVMFIRPLHNRVKYYITDVDGSRGDFMDVADEHYETWEQATLAGIKYVLDNLI